MDSASDDVFDLELVPLDDLLNELKRRLSGLVFIGERMHESLPNHTETLFRWGGSINLAIGLAARAGVLLRKDERLGRVDFKEEDDDEGEGDDGEGLQSEDKAD